VRFRLLVCDASVQPKSARRYRCSRNSLHDCPDCSLARQVVQCCHGGSSPALSLRVKRLPGDVAMITILVVILLLAALGALPTWPHSRGWGYYPSSGLGLVVLVLVILLLLGRI
jgi:hypothetical protein